MAENDVVAVEPEAADNHDTGATIQDTSVESTPEPTVPVSQEDQPKKPKRLTLQERLAMAAKKKKKAAAEGNSAPPSPKPAEPAPIEPLPPAETDEVAEIRKELEKVKLQSQELEEQNRRLVAESKKTATNDVDKKLAEKDALIQQLMEEGQALSGKEIKLHEKIRAMAATNAKLEHSLKDYASKNEDALLRLEEVESIMKTHKLKSVDQLLELLETNGRKLAEATSALEAEKAKNWEAKYKEQQRQYEAELQEKRNAQKELDEARLKLQMAEQQQSLDVKLKEDTISYLKDEVSRLKEESSLEISRLEAKVEALRLENEGFMKTLVTEATPTEAEAKHIAYSEYAKLSEAHKNLHQQYVSSQENWKLIELQLLSKADALLELLNALKKAKVKAQGEIRKLGAQLTMAKEELSQAAEQQKELEKAIKDLQFQVSVKEDDYKELEAKKDELQAIFNTDRHNWELQEQKLKLNIEKLEETIQELRELNMGGSNVDSFAQLQSRKLRDLGLHISMNEDPQTPGLTPGLGQLSQPSFNNLFEANMLAVSLTDLDLFEATEGPVPDDALVYWKNLADRSGVPAAQGGKNIQLLSKMSANIRRLEMELLALKEENEMLSSQKDEAQQEIVAQQDLSVKLALLEEEIERLQKEIGKKLEREATLLDVIGEKSMLVEELRADVEDLKNICHQQVEQMIGMAEKK